MFCRVPFLMVGGLLISGERTDTIDSAFFYGRAQVRKTLQFLITFSFSLVYFFLSSLFPLLEPVKETSTFTYN